MAKIWGNAVKVDKNEKRKYIILNIFKNVSQQYIFGSYFLCVCICEIYENITTFMIFIVGKKIYLHT